MIYVILIVIVLVLEENDKKRILEELNKRKTISYCPHCGKKIQEENIEKIKLNNTLNIEQKPKIKEKKLTDKEIKNNTILITGAILVVLSSIIFLTSSWYNISNILKSFIIIFMTIIFSVLSKLAHKYNLKNTSKTFMYISLIYLPISLMSLSFFELVGSFFSISGAGKNIYLAMIFFATSIIYTYINKKINKTMIFSLNVCVQILTIIFTTLIFSNNFMIALTLILIYNFGLIYLYKYSTQFKDSKYLITINIINYLLLPIIFIYNLSYLMLNDITVINSLAILILLINFYLINTIKNENIFNYIYPILTTAIFFNIANISSFDLSYLSKQIIILLSILTLCIYDLIKFKKIKFESFIEMSLVFIIMWFSSMMKDYNEFYLYPYLISYIYTIVTFVSLVYFDKYRKNLTYLFTTMLFFSPINMCMLNNFNFISIYILSIVIITIPLLKFISDEFLKESFSIIGSIFLIISTLLTKFNIIYLLLTLLTIFIYNIYVNKYNINYKYIIYYLINILLFKVSHTFVPELDKYVIPITTIIIIALETVYKKYKDINNSIYILIQYILSIIILNLNISQFTCILLLILNMYSIFYILHNNLNKNFMILITVSLVPTIYFSDIFIFKAEKKSKLIKKSKLYEI